MAVFKVQRLIKDFGASDDVVNLSLTGDFPSGTAVGSLATAFARIANTHHSSAGAAAGTTTERGTAYLCTRCELTGTNNVRLERASNATNEDTRNHVEVIEYTGDLNGENALVVRFHGVVTHPGTGAVIVDTPVDGITTLSDCVPIVCGTLNSDGGVSPVAWTRVAVTAEMVNVGGQDYVRLTKGTGGSGGTSQWSVAVVEFIGSNWTIEKVVHNWTSAGSTDQTESVSTVSDWTKSFIIAHCEIDSNNVQRSAYVVRPGSSTSTVRFWRRSSTAADSVIAYVISNPDITVEHLDSITGGGTDFPTGSPPDTQNRTITTVSDLSQTLIWMYCDESDTGDDYGKPNRGYRPSTTSNVEIFRGRANSPGTNEWAIQVITLPATSDADIQLSSSSLQLVGQVATVEAVSAPEPPPEPFVSPDTFVLIARPYDVSAATEVEVYFSNNGYGSTPADAPASQLFRSVLRSPYNARSELFSGGRISEDMSPGFGEIEIIVPDADVQALKPLAWAGRSVQILAGDYDDPLSTFGTIYDGTCSGVTWSSNRLEIRLRGHAFELERKQIQERLFGGFDQCLRLDGSNDAVLVGNHPAAHVLGDLSVEAQARYFIEPPLGGSNVLASYSALGGAPTTVNEDAPWLLRIDVTNRRLVYQHYHSGGTAVLVQSATDTIPAAYFSDGWLHHYAFSRDAATGTVKLYLDGAEIGSGTYSTSTAAPDRGEDCSLRLGKGVFSTAWDFSGDLDDVRVWREAKHLELVAVGSTNEKITDAYNHALDGTEQNLEAYYPCDEGTGSTTFDSVSLRDDRLQRHRCLRFNGSSAQVQIPHDAALALNSGDRGTWEVMFKGVQGLAAIAGVMAKANAYRTYINASDKIIGGMYDGTTWREITGPDLDDDIHMVSMTWNGFSDDLKMYVDGVLIDTQNFAGASISDNSSNLRFGSLAGTNFLNGWVLEARLWSIIRAATDIQGDWDQQLIGTETGLVAYWKIDEDTGSTVGDTVGSNDGTITDAVWVNTDGALEGEATFVGTGEGSEDIAGEIVPVVLGHRRQIPLIQVDELNQIWKAAEGLDRTPIQEIVSVSEGGDELTAGTLVGSDIWSHTFTTEDYVVDLVHGFVRFAGAQAGTLYPLTADVKGDNTGSGGYVETAPEVAERIARVVGGLTDADIDDLTFANLAASWDARVGLYINSEMTAAEGISAVMSAIHAAAVFRRDGVLTVVQLIDPENETADFSFAQDRIRRDTLEREFTEEPTWRQRVGWRPHDFVYSREQINGTQVTDERIRAKITKEIRYVKADNLDNRADYLSSEAITTDTVLLRRRDGVAEAAARMALFGVERHYYRFDPLTDLFNYQLGDIVNLQDPDDPVLSGAGRNFVVIGWEEDVVSNRVTLFLWG